MLVLSRRVNERIEIGDEIVIMVVRIEGDKVKIGIEAPPDVPVHRAEVADKIRKIREGAKPIMEMVNRVFGETMNTL